MRLATLCALFALLLEGAPSYPVNGELVGQPQRYLAAVSTDKPIYRAGETVYMRVAVLDAKRHTAIANGPSASFTIKGPKGDTIASGNGYGSLGVVGLGWTIPAEIAGGEYTTHVEFGEGFAPCERKFDIRVFRAPRLKTQIEFARDGYGPSDTVRATLHVERAEGGFPRGAKVTVSALVDGTEAYAGGARVDESGNATTSFPLPASIARGEGTLAMTIEDGGVVETATKTIPILLMTLDLSFFPEGGDLVTGLLNRVYVQAKTPAKKPVDLTAVVVDDQGKEQVTFATEHEGRGRFVFTPAAGRTYSLRILAPSGITRLFPLPAAKASGVVLSSATEIVAKGESVKVRLAATAADTYTVTVQQREAAIASKAVTIGEGSWFKRGPRVGELTDVELPVPNDVVGVLIVTAWSSKGVPLAERLVFRQESRKLVVKIKQDKQMYVPGGSAKLDLTTLDESGNPIAATIGLTVTDESVLEMIEKREQAPRLPVMMLLEPEVAELADAHVYLDAANPKAPLATDLLLGTQGWRRFALKDAAAFVNQFGDQARRALAVQPPPPPPVDHLRFEERAIPMMAAEAMPVPAAVAPVKAARAPAARPAMQKGAVAEARPQRAMAPRPAPAAAAAPMVRADKKELAKPVGGLMMGARARRMAADMDEVAAQPAQNMAYVREYAHQVRPDRQPNDRVDFAETLYWNAAIRTDASGKASVTFGLSDAVTAFRIAADGFSDAGGLGLGTASLKSVQPFYLEPKVPLQLTSGDVVELPVALVNGTSSALDNAAITVKASKEIGVGSTGSAATVPALGRQRRLVRLDTARATGVSELVVSGQAGTYTDQVTRTLDVRPAGFPMAFNDSGILEANTTATAELELAQEIIPGSLTSEIGVYPTPLANLTQALTALMQEPYGCFEQTSSTSYPLTMAQQYFVTHEGVEPDLVRKAGEILTRGYQRLTSFECKDKGYEWFGGAAPGHEALTAYGLMQFADMRRAKLSLVDSGMVGRTREWLFARRDGKGGFARNQRALDSFGGAPEATTNAYITWALLAAGEHGLESEVAQVKKSAEASNDSYVVALGANVASLAGDADTARRLMQKLAAKQEKSGAVGGAMTSITRSGGMALGIETTSLAALAWMRDAKHAGNVEQAMRFIADSCQGGRFSSTQATVLALKAIVTYDEMRAGPKAAGSLELMVDDARVGSPLAFDATTKGALTLPSLASKLGPGKHTVRIRMSSGSRMPYSIAIRYNTPRPASSEKAKLLLSTVLQDTSLTEGKVTELRAEVTNTSAEDAASPVAILGVPGGLEVRHDQLKELVKAGRIAAYEVLGREVVLYWRQLRANEKVTIALSLLAAIPGRFNAPASRVYEYYTDEYKRWAPGVRVEISPLPNAP